MENFIRKYETKFGDSVLQQVTQYSTFSTIRKQHL